MEGGEVGGDVVMVVMSYEREFGHDLTTTIEAPATLPAELRLDLGRQITTEWNISYLAALMDSMDPVPCVPMSPVSPMSPFLEPLASVPKWK